MNLLSRLPGQEYIAIPAMAMVPMVTAESPAPLPHTEYGGTKTIEMPAI